MSSSTDLPPDAEAASIVERLIVAPAGGILRLRPPQTVTAEGEVVGCGQVIGTIERTIGPVDVVSVHDGFMMGLLARPGERVRHHQPVAWLRPFEP